jgi:hypothetical protein
VPTIRISVSARRVFTLPADLPTTREHFRDFRLMLRYLPDLRLVKTYAPNKYRILYGAAEVRIYRVALYSDIRTRFDDAEDTLYVTPLEGITAVASRATLTSLTGQGEYSSQLMLRSDGRRTNAKYCVQIRAELAKPVGVKLIPNLAVRHFVERVVRRRIQEITDEFIRRAIEGLRPPQRNPG